MEALFVIMAGLMLGLRGVRKEAMERVMEDMRQLWQGIECDNIYLEKELEREAEEKLEEASKNTISPWAVNKRWTLKVKRWVLASHKISCIKALREVSNMGLKEAKEAIEREMYPKAGEEWFTMSSNVNAAQLGMALDSLLNLLSSTPTYGEDVLATKH